MKISIKRLRSLIKEALDQQYPIIEPKDNSPYADTFNKDIATAADSLVKKNGWDSEFVQTLDVALNEALWLAMVQLTTNIKKALPQITDGELAGFVDEIAGIQLEHFVGYISAPPPGEEVVKALKVQNNQKN